MHWSVCTPTRELLGASQLVAARDRGAHVFF